MQISLFSEKFKLFLKLQKNWNSVSFYLKKLPMLYGIKMKNFLQYINIQKPTEYDAITRSPIFFVFATKNGVNLFFFRKINISFFFTVTHPNNIPTDPKM